MKKQELNFLLGLHTDINRGCGLLQVERTAFMPTLDRFFETVSLGIELGLKMSRRGEQLVKPTPPSKMKPAAGPKTKRKATFSAVIAAILGKRTLGLPEIEAALVKAKKAPKSSNLRSYLSATMSASKTADGKKTFTSSKRGHYFVTAKGSTTAKVSTAKAKAPKAKAGKADLHRSPKVLEVITATLGKNGPMSLGDLTKAAKQHLKGLKDPSKTVWTILSKSPEVEHTSTPGVYRLKAKKAVTNGKAVNGKATHAAVASN
jgi:hypothetical protein